MAKSTRICVELLIDCLTHSNYYSIPIPALSYIYPFPLQMKKLKVLSYWSSQIFPRSQFCKEGCKTWSFEPKSFLRKIALPVLEFWWHLVNGAHRSIPQVILTACFSVVLYWMDGKKKKSAFVSWKMKNLRIFAHNLLIQSHLLIYCVSHSFVSDSFAAPRTVARQAPLPLEFSRQEYWSGLPFPTIRCVQIICYW